MGKCYTFHLYTYVLQSLVMASSNKQFIILSFPDKSLSNLPTQER